jgi:hypothetical protein
VSRHEGPDFRVVPDDQRCEAMVRGVKSHNFEWQRVDHRCPREANQGRAGRMVCHIHGRSKRVEWYSTESA